MVDQGGGSRGGRSPDTGPAGLLGQGQQLAGSMFGQVPVGHGRPGGPTQGFGLLRMPGRPGELGVEFEDVVIKQRFHPGHKQRLHALGRPFGHDAATAGRGLEQPLIDLAGNGLVGRDAGRIVKGGQGRPEHVVARDEVALRQMVHEPAPARAFAGDAARKGQGRGARGMLTTVAPKFFIPVHGEYRHLVKHARLAISSGVAPERALVIEDGQPVTFFADGGIRLEEAIPVEHIYVDGKGVGDVGVTVLKERQLLAGEGLVIVVLVVDEKSGELTFGPNILSKGFVFEQHYSHVLEDAKCIVLDIFENVPPGQSDLLKERIRSALRRFFRKILERDPVVVPLVITL